jgi:hypothetical protein
MLRKAIEMLKKATGAGAPARPNFAEAREKLAQQKAAHKRPPLRPTAVKGDPIAGLKIDERRPLEAMEKAVLATHDKMKEARSTHSALASEQKSTARAMDTGYYVCLVFDAGNQCDAFIKALKARVYLSEPGDMFLDGRQIADAMGIDIPAPEYSLIQKKHGATGQIASFETISKPEPKGKAKVVKAPEPKPKAPRRRKA